MHKLLGSKPTNIACHEVILMQRALPLTMRHTPKRSKPITMDMLRGLCAACDTLGDIGPIFKLAFVLAFFGFLRQSNLAPKHAGQFDATRHPTRGDLQVAPPGLLFHLKWSKTRQAAHVPEVIPIPSAPGQTVDPVAAYSRVLQTTPTRHTSDPLLMLPNRRVITTTALQRILKLLIAGMGHEAADYTMHSFRRGGATASYNAGVKYIDIKRHGTWASDSFWLYVAQG